jgi:hypothetical protein
MADRGYDAALTVGGPKAETPSDGPTVLKNLRSKYPQYSDLSDQALASSIVKQYPTYRDVLGDIATPPNLLQRGWRAYQGRVESALKGKSDLAESAKQATGYAPKGAVQSPEEIRRDAKLLAPILATLPLTGGGGAAGSALARGAGMLPRALPAAGRIAGSAAGGGISAGGEGRSIPLGAILGTVGGLTGEAGMTALSRLARTPQGVKVLAELWKRWKGQTGAAPPAPILYGPTGRPIPRPTIQAPKARTDQALERARELLRDPKVRAAVDAVLGGSKETLALALMAPGWMKNQAMGLPGHILSGVMHGGGA